MYTGGATTSTNIQCGGLRIASIELIKGRRGKRGEMCIDWMEGEKYRLDREKGGSKRLKEDDKERIEIKRMIGWWKERREANRKIGLHGKRERK